MKITRFEDLNIWKESMVLTKEIYKTTSCTCFTKDRGLQDQIRRASISISSNIVEGFEKNNNNEFIRFLKISKGSIGEVRNQLHIALMINYITQDQFDHLNTNLDNLAKQVGGFIAYLQKKRENKEFLKK